MTSPVLLAATKKLAQLAEYLSGNAMCHDLALASEEALTQAASEVALLSSGQTVACSTGDAQHSLENAEQSLTTEPVEATKGLQHTVQRKFG